MPNDGQAIVSNLSMLIVDAIESALVIGAHTLPHTNTRDSWLTSTFFNLYKPTVTHNPSQTLTTIGTSWRDLSLVCTFNLGAIIIS